MNKKLLKEIKEIFEDKNISFDTHLRKEKDWDSLISLNLISLLDEKYDLEVSLEEIEKIEKIKDIERLINSKQIIDNR